MGIGGMTVLQVAFTYVPAMNQLFASAPIGLSACARVLGAGALAFLIVEIEKASRRRARRPEREAGTSRAASASTQ